ncbi:hypothetical protein M218_07170 [Burkholderia pseudomallei MSHR338]|nr:hypothetical protein M218_07170 [Burkholderia pseudomallei MSHR338]
MTNAMPRAQARGAFASGIDAPVRNRR